MSSGLAGRQVVITGASRGIGEAIAKLLAQQGAHVIVSSRKIDGCQPVAEAIIAAGAVVAGLAYLASQQDALVPSIKGLDTGVQQLATDLSKLDGRSLREVGDEVVRGFDPHGEPDQRGWDGEGRFGGGGVRHAAGVLDEALDSAEALGEPPDLRPGSECDRLLLVGDLVEFRGPVPQFFDHVTPERHAEGGLAGMHHGHDGLSGSGRIARLFSVNDLQELGELAGTAVIIGQSLRNRF